MALAKESRISAIVEMASTLGKKERAVLGSRLKDWSESELVTFQESLEKLEGVEDKITRKPNKKQDTETERMLAKIFAKLEENENQGVKLCIDAISKGIKLVGDKLDVVEKSAMIKRFNELAIAIENISMAKAMMQFEQGRLIQFLSNKFKMSLEELALTFNITKRKVNEFDSYYKLCLDYPGLVFSSYTMGTILRIKSAIKKKADQDPRFMEMLKLQIEGVTLIHSKDPTNLSEEKMVRSWFEDDMDNNTSSEVAVLHEELAADGIWKKSE